MNTAGSRTLAYLTLHNSLDINERSHFKEHIKFFLVGVRIDFRILFNCFFNCARDFSSVFKYKVGWHV